MTAEPVFAHTDAERDAPDEGMSTLPAGGPLAYLHTVANLFEEGLRFQATARRNGDSDRTPASERFGTLVRTLVAREKLDTTLPIHELRRRFALSRFEERVLLFAVAAQLDMELCRQIAASATARRRPYVTPALCLGFFSGPRRMAFYQILFGGNTVFYRGNHTGYRPHNRVFNALPPKGTQR